MVFGKSGNYNGVGPLDMREHSAIEKWEERPCASSSAGGGECRRVPAKRKKPAGRDGMRERESLRIHASGGKNSTAVYQRVLILGMPDWRSQTASRRAVKCLEETVDIPFAKPSA